MKFIYPLTAAAVLASALAMPAAAHPSAFGQTHVHVVPAPVLTPLFPRRPAWADRIDPSVLHPIPQPRPFPWPGPICLTCPPMPLDERVITPVELMR